MSLLPLIFLPARKVLYLFAFGLLREFTWTAHRGTILMVLLIVAVWADIFLWHLNRQIRWWEHLLRVIFLRQQCVIYQALGRRRLWPEISSQQLCHVLRRFLAEAITHGEGIRLCGMYCLALAFRDMHCSRWGYTIYSRSNMVLKKSTPLVVFHR